MKPKCEPSQRVLCELFDEADAIADFAVTVFLAIRKSGDEGEAVATVVSDMITRLGKMKGALHDLVEWA